MKTIFVTRVQVAAARLKLALDDQFGREHDPAVVAIANAKRLRKGEDDA